MAKQEMVIIFLWTHSHQAQGGFLSPLSFLIYECLRVGCAWMLNAVVSMNPTHTYSLYFHFFIHASLIVPSMILNHTCFMFPLFELLFGKVTCHIGS